MHTHRSIRWRTARAVIAAAVVTLIAGTKASSAATSAAPASTHGVSPAGPGRPADFPIAPGLSKCQPIVTGPEVICEWHGADGHAVYEFYHAALPKAGYILLPGAAETTSPKYLGALGFSKGDVKGAVTIQGGDVTVQVIYGNAK